MAWRPSSADGTALAVTKTARHPDTTPQELARLALTLHRTGPLATYAFLTEAASDGIEAAARRYAPLQPETLAKVLSIAARER